MLFNVKGDVIIRESVIIVNKNYKELNPVQFGWEQCDPRHAFGPAVRTNWLLHYVVSGSGIFCRDGKTHILQRGDMFIIRPYEETFYKADGIDPWNYIWIGFTGDFPISQVLNRPVLHLPDQGAVFEEMLYCTRLENGREAFLSGCLFKLMSALMEQQPVSSDYIDKAVGLIHSQYSDGITVQQIADRLNLDRCYFSCLFKERMGIPPRDYLINLRLEKAVKLMREHNETPSTAAASVGYGDLYHFSKIFKKRYGLSPRNYLKSLQK